MLEGGYAVWYLTYAVTCVGVYRRRTNVPSPASEDSGSGTVPGGQEGEGGTSGLDYPSFPEIKDLSDEGEGEGSDSSESDTVAMETEQKVHQHLTTPTTSQTTPTTIGMHYGAAAYPGSMEPLVGPTFVNIAAPLPPAPSTIPVALALEGENASTLSSEHDLLSDYPQLLMRGDYDENSLPVEHYSTVPATVMTFTQPVDGHLQMADGISLQQHNIQPPQNVGGLDYQQQFIQQNISPQNSEEQIRPPPHTVFPPTHNLGGQSQQIFPPHNVGGQIQQVPSLHTVAVQIQPESIPQNSGGLIQSVGGQVQNLNQQVHNFGGQMQQVPSPHSSGGQMQQVPPPHSSGGQFHQILPSQNSGGQNLASTRQNYPEHPHQQFTPPNGTGGPQQQAPPPNNTVSVTPPAVTSSLSQNQRVATGAIPSPPSYEVALTLPLEDTPPPLPPPISLAPEQLPREESGHVIGTAVVPGIAGTSPAEMGVASPVVPEGRSPGGGEIQKLREETEKLKELRSQMESEISRISEVRVQQEVAAKQLALGQAALEAQRANHAREMEQQKREFNRMKKKYEQDVETMVTEKQRYLQLQEAEKKKAQDRGGVAEQQHHRELAQRAGLPGGWEKRLDHRRGGITTWTTPHKPHIGILRHNSSTTRGNKKKWLGGRARAVSRQPLGMLLGDRWKVLLGDRWRRRRGEGGPWKRQP